MLFFILILLSWVLFSGVYIEFLPSFLGYWYILIYILAGFLSTIIFFIFITLFLVYAIYKNTKINSKFKHWILWQYTDFILIVCKIKLEVIGKENIPSETFVIYGNHKSMLDPVFIYNIYRKRMSAAAKSTLNKIPVLRTIMKTLGVILINRENDREAMKAIITGIDNINKYDLSYMIFPEGGIKTREVETMSDVKPGSYKLATKANAVISPVSIIGSSKIATRGIFSITKVKVIIHKPIYPEEYNELSTTELGDKVLEIVNEGVINGR